MNAASAIVRMSNMLCLYGSPRSRAFRCVWMLEELELSYDIVPTAWTGGETRMPEFLKINPNGKIPTLVDDDLVIWESLAINHYLVRTYGGALAPTSNDDVGLAYRWSFWAMGEFEGPIDAVARYGVELEQDWAETPLRVLNRALSSKHWLAGDSFGVADLNVAVMFQRPVLASVDRRPFELVHDWLKRCRARPSFDRMMEIGQEADPNEA